MRNTVKHAIVLADREWCEAATSGKIRVYDFRERKKGIHALGPGSVCVVLSKAGKNQPQVVYGEFRVVDVKQVNVNEYNKLASQGLIYKPQTLKPGERRWIIIFDEFREYQRKVPKEQLTDVKTSTSKKPISEWVIMGLSYIDDQALEGIRKKTQITPLNEISERIKKLEERVAFIEKLLGVESLVSPLSHECAEFMLLNIGKQLGFRVYTSDLSKMCEDTKLGDLADLDKDELGKYAGSAILEPLSKIDVVWYRSGIGFYAFEVVIGGNMRDALLRLSEISMLTPRLFIVSDRSRESEFEKTISLSVFNSIRDKCKFITLDSLARMFILTRLWSLSVKDLQLPYIM